jgi:hypothetical protein
VSRALLLSLASLSLLLACQRALPPVEVTPLESSVGYVEDVQPVLDRRCVVCHSCYNAPCQLKLSSYEGVDRGGSHAAVYSSSRLREQDLTRLFFDARSTAGWRAKGFHSVTDSSVGGPYNDSILLHLLDAKRRLPMSTGEYHSEAANLTCAGRPEQIGSLLDRHPGSGMPFGFPPLSEEEYATMATWLQEGARGPSPQQQRDLNAPSPAAAAAIAKWEDFLNGDDAKHALTARYLYEHFFLAHLSFRAAGPHEFYAIVRSTTPPGEPVDVIATRRPYDAPGVAPVFYRFRKIHATIVYKTHMVVELDDAALERIRRQFIATP